MLSSTSSLGSSTHIAAPGSPASGSQVARTYKQASQLFVTRRVTEALQVLDPVIHPPARFSSSNSEGNDDSENANEQATSSNGSFINNYGESNGSVGISHSSTSAIISDEVVSSSKSRAPVTTASRAARVKVWSLYVSILNAIVEMDTEEGKQAFGTSRYAELVKSVREGSVWEDIVRWGYDGNEAAVDAHVVSNLATLLLAQANSQQMTQHHLETYLSSTSGMPSATNLASEIERSSTFSDSGSFMASANGNGTSTPRDLDSRLRILEIYALHVLPANQEWDYAKEFINLSEVLDEERREAFLMALESLREERSVESRRERELAVQRAREQELQEERQREEDGALEARRKEEQQRQALQRSEQSCSTNEAGRSTANETDFGVDKSRPNGPLKSNKQSSGAADSFSAKLPVSNAPARKNPRPPPRTLYRRASLFLAAIQQSLFNLGSNFSRQPVAMLRMILFMFALAMALARQDVRQRLKDAKAMAWNKLRSTIGMGVKVSYL